MWVLREGELLDVRMLGETELDESLRCASGDGVEAWLNSLMCLDAAKVSGILSVWFGCWRGTGDA